MHILLINDYILKDSKDMNQMIIVDEKICSIFTMRRKNFEYNKKIDRTLRRFSYSSMYNEIE